MKAKVKTREALRVALRRFCLKEAAEARSNIDMTVEQSAFDRGYFLGMAHAHEVLVREKLERKG